MVGVPVKCVHAPKYKQFTSSLWLCLHTWQRQGMWQNREMGDAWSPYPVGSDSGNFHRILMEAWVNTLIYWHVGNIRSFHSMCLKACSCVTWQLQTSSGPRHRNTMWAVRRWKEKRGQTSLVRQEIQQGSIWTSLCVLLIVRNVFYTWSGVKHCTGVRNRSKACLQCCFRPLCQWEMC